MCRAGMLPAQTDQLEHGTSFRQPVGGQYKPRTVIEIGVEAFNAAAKD